MKRWLVLAFLAVMSGCVGKPANVEPVSNFQLDRYLGRWYEVARLDHSFERGLSKVSAEYSLRDDGGVRVINRGYDAEKGEWKEAEGKAYFVQTPDTGYLKVSFFGPFYGSYVVFALDQQHYQYTMISGPDTDYLWILARQPVLDDAVKMALIEKAKSLGFATDQLIFVKHD